MPRRLAFDASVDLPAVDMYRHFTTIGYWQDLVRFYVANGSHTELEHFYADGTGTDVTLSYAMTANDLPPIARRLVPRSFVVTREQHFDPFDAPAGQANGRFRGRVPAPVEITGETLLQNTEQGCRMRLTSACRVRVPIIGGQIENLVLGGLKLLFTHEGEFTEDWITHHR